MAEITTITQISLEEWIVLVKEQLAVLEEQWEMTNEQYAQYQTELQEIEGKLENPEALTSEDVAAVDSFILEQQTLFRDNTAIAEEVTDGEGAGETAENPAEVPVKTPVEAPEDTPTEETQKMTEETSVDETEAKTVEETNPADETTEGKTVEPVETTTETTEAEAPVSSWILPQTLLGAAGGFLLGVAVTCAAFRMMKKRKNGKKKQNGKISAPKADIRVCNVHNVGKRSSQQDSFCISNVMDDEQVRTKGVMGVVADGMGGLQSGDQISQIVTDTFLQRYRSFDIADPVGFMVDSIWASEQYVEEFMRQNRVDGGSTLVAVMMKDGALSFVSVGDSYIFLIREKSIIRLNQLHNFGEILRERAARGEITVEEAETNSMRNSLTSYIGMGQISRIDSSTAPIELQNGDMILLCSDGVYNALGDDLLLSTVLEGPFETAADRLEQKILEQDLPRQDNFTAVLLQYNV